MLLCVWKHFWQSSPPNISSQYTIHIMHLFGHPEYIKMWIILLKMIYIFWTVLSFVKDRVLNFSRKFINLT